MTEIHDTILLSLAECPINTLKINLHTNTQ